FLRLSGSAVLARSRWISPGLGGVWTGEDWRLDPREALEALVAAGEAAGVRRISGSVEGFERGRAVLSDGETVTADHLVIATGASESLAALAPELRHLTPVKGHILSMPGVAAPGPVVRYRAGYICPTARGVLIGSTMERGRRDRAVDPKIARKLLDAAAKVSSHVANGPLVARTGVRAATPDGLPLVGRSETDGVWLAVGTRRNGWLLAPLIADLLGQALAGGEPDRRAPLFAPGRFAR
ncbi:MAG: FAD-dependent oxidoreductase, partial [Caulobacteraceae bacterium]